MTLENLYHKLGNFGSDMLVYVDNNPIICVAEGDDGVSQVVCITSANRGNYTPTVEELIVAIYNIWHKDAFAPVSPDVLANGKNVKWVGLLDDSDGEYIGIETSIDDAV